MMFPDELSLSEIQKVLPIVQLQCCCYKSRKFCDCKFGAASHVDKIEEDPNHLNKFAFGMHTYLGEQTGCPEVRFLELFFSAMTEQEFNRIKTRADKAQMKKWKAFAKTPEYKEIMGKMKTDAAAINAKISKSKRG